MIQPFAPTTACTARRHARAFAPRRLRCCAAAISAAARAPDRSPSTPSPRRRSKVTSPASAARSSYVLLGIWPFARWRRAGSPTAPGGRRSRRRAPWASSAPIAELDRTRPERRGPPALGRAWWRRHVERFPQDALRRGRQAVDACPEMAIDVPALWIGAGSLERERRARRPRCSQSPAPSELAALAGELLEMIAHQALEH